MATLAISADFLAEFAQLEKRQQKRVLELADKFHRMSAGDLRSSNGIHLEAHTNARDDRARTVRIDDNHRGIVIDAGDNETFILTAIGTHDESDRWMARNTFRVNERTGALEVRNVVAIEEIAQTVAGEPESDALFSHRKDKDFTQLGIDDYLVPTLRAFTDDDELQGLLLVLPQTQTDAIMGLLGNETVEQIYSVVAGSIDPATIDTADLAAALDAPASKTVYQVFTTEDELNEMLAQPLERWRVYLHHTQQELAEKDVYNGPVRVTGGAGTGKTVVAMHRARALANRIDDRNTKPILFTTFTANLAQVIEMQLRSLGGSELLDVVDVMTVDALAHRVVRDAEGETPAIQFDPHEIWQRVSDERGGDFAAEFLQAEWEQVILAQGCESRSDYLQAPRAGRGIPLDRRSRAQVWKAVEQYQRNLSETGRRSYLQLASAAAGYLAGRTVKPYQHVIVDEAQDLHETQWRLLRAAVPEQANDMFIVGDTHQRIYDRRSSLSKVGIKIVGRSHKLRINYRTTHEILRWAMKLLGDEEFDDLDNGLDEQDHSGYYSYLHGAEPTMVGARSKQQELEALVEQVVDWIRGGIGEREIGIAARTSGSLSNAQAALKSAGIGAVMLERDHHEAAEGVRLGTMHRMKGLEFRAMAIIDVGHDSLPHPLALTSKSLDETQHRRDLVREKSLLYVACTRAREQLWVGWSGKPSRFLGSVLEPE